MQKRRSPQFAFAMGSATSLSWRGNRRWLPAVIPEHYVCQFLAAWLARLKSGVFTVVLAGWPVDWRLGHTLYGATVLLCGALTERTSAQ